MRQIKFRAWTGSEMKIVSALYFNHPNDGKIACRVANDIKDELVFAEAIMQSTSLMDKNEKEIYEGDIVKYILSDVMPEDEGTEYTEQVLFNEGVFSVDGLTPLYVAVEWSCEVIGNVFENPDLLK